MKRLLPVATVSLLALAWTTPAFALSCDEIMNMVDVNVPPNIIVQTIQSSGESFSADDIRCLQSKGAPGDVLDAAKAQAASVSGSKAKPADEGDGDDEGADTKPAKGSDFDSSEGIGDNKVTKGGSKSLEDRGNDEEEDTAKDPQKLDDAIKYYEAKKPLSASLAFYEMLRDNEFPDKESKIQYYLGRSLFDLGMYHSSQYYFTEVLKKGPSNPYFKYALPKLVTIAKFTGDETDLARIVAKVPPEEFPRSARNQLYYLLGTRLFEQGKLTEARKYFGQVSDKSDLYTRSKYYEGVIYAKQEKLKSAVRSFTDVVKTKGEAQTEQELDELDRLRDLAILQIGGIYYSIGRYDDANTWFGNVPRDSLYWPDAEFRSAWSNFMLSDLNLSLGQLLTVQSPFYAEQEWNPEAPILRALTFFSLCDYSNINRELDSFDARYKPMHEELKEFIKQYSTDEGKKLADQAYDRYFGPHPDKTTLPKSFFVKILRNRELAGIVTHLEVMDREEQLIDAQKSQWKDAVGENLHKVISEDRERLKRRAGLMMLQEMAGQTLVLADELTQSQIIRFEVVDAKRVDYAYKLQNQDLTDTSKEFQLDFATSPNRIYWPFNGEFWQDELGYYYYTEQANCK